MEPGGSGLIVLFMNHTAVPLRALLALLATRYFQSHVLKLV